MIGFFAFAVQKVELQKTVRQIVQNVQLSASCKSNLNSKDYNSD